jgi:hypothetical protein
MSLTDKENERQKVFHTTEYILESITYMRSRNAVQVKSISGLLVLRASEGTFNCWPWLHLQSLSLINLHGHAWWVMARSPYV